MSADPALAPGTLVAERYALVESIHPLGAGVAYCALDTRDPKGARVRVTFLRPPTEVPRERLARLTEPLRALDHPNVLPLLDWGVFSGKPFRVTPLEQSETLAEWLEKLRREGDRVELTRIFALIEPLCAGVAAAHDAGIVHGCLRPACIALRHGPKDTLDVRISDFGVAEVDTLKSERLARALGSSEYIAPEQAMQSEESPASDVFALAVIAAELLGARPSSARPFWQLAFEGTVGAHLRALRDDVPTALWDVLATALASEPARRPANASALLEALRAAWPLSARPARSPDPASIPDPPARPAAPPPPTPARGPQWIDEAPHAPAPYAPSRTAFAAMMRTPEAPAPRADATIRLPLAPGGAVDGEATVQSAPPGELTLETFASEDALPTVVAPAFALDEPPSAQHAALDASAPFELSPDYSSPDFSRLPRPLRTLPHPEDQVSRSSKLAPTALTAPSSPPSPLARARRAFDELGYRQKIGLLLITGSAVLVVGALVAARMGSSSGVQRARLPASIEHSVAHEIPGVPEPTDLRSGISTAAAAPTRGCPAGTVLVPAARFTPQGVPADGGTVRVAELCADRTEVTVAGYRECVRAGRCTGDAISAHSVALAPSLLAALSRLCALSSGAPDNAPINCVDAQQAADYCSFRGARLPTEAEWEYLASGGEGRDYPWGQELPAPELLNGCGTECRTLPASLGIRGALYPTADTWPTLAPTGSVPLGAGPFGALDLAGNVAEWTADDAQTGSATTGEMLRVVRGGSWADSAASAVRVTSRRVYRADTRLPQVGFRCVRPFGT